MCMFCAAIPMSASLGIAFVEKQKERRQNAIKYGKKVARKPISVKKVTFALTSGLIVSSAVYHLIIMPYTGPIV